MNKKYSRVVGLLLMTGLVMSVWASSSLAAPPVPVVPVEPPGDRCSRDWNVGINQAAAETFGMSVDEVIEALHNGAVLVELAENQRQVLLFKAKLMEQLNEQIDQAVTEGRISEDVANRLKAALPALANFVAENGGGPYWGQAFAGGKGWGLWREDVSAYLEMSIEELAADLLSGQSLGEITEAQGQSVDGLIDLLLTEAAERLSNAVEKGLLTQEQADKIYGFLQKMMGRLIYTTGPCSAEWDVGELRDIL